MLLILSPVLVSAASETFAGVCGVSLESVSKINVVAGGNAAEQSEVAGSFTLIRTDDLAKKLSVTFTLTGSAENSVDYKQVGETVSFDAGQTKKTISIAAIDDNHEESDETITLTIIPQVGYILGNNISDTIILSDNDGGAAPGFANVEEKAHLSYSDSDHRCHLDQIQWLSTADKLLLPKPSDGAEYLSDFDFVGYTMSSCSPGSTVNFTLHYQQQIPTNARLMQFIPTVKGSAGHWIEIATSEIKGNKVAYTITDGQDGDNDLAVNGSVFGQVGLLVPKRVQVAAPSRPLQVKATVQARSIPAVSPFGLLLLMTSLVFLTKRALSDN